MSDPPASPKVIRTRTHTHTHTQTARTPFGRRCTPGALDLARGRGGIHACGEGEVVVVLVVFITSIDLRGNEYSEYYHDGD